MFTSAITGNRSYRRYELNQQYLNNSIHISDSKGFDDQDDGFMHVFVYALKAHCASLTSFHLKFAELESFASL